MAATAAARSPTRSDIEIKRYFLLFYPTFRDALGRVLSRKKSDSSDFQKAFSPVLTQIAAAYSIGPDTVPGNMILPDATVGFVRDYIDFMAHRGKDWATDKADAIAAEELKRSLRVLREKSLLPEVIRRDRGSARMIKHSKTYKETTDAGGVQAVCHCGWKSPVVDTSNDFALGSLTAGNPRTNISRST